MINKEEMYAIGWLSALNIKSEYEATNKEILLNYIDKLADRIKELEEINEEHQKENGKLQEKLTRCKIKNDVLTEIIEGKAIREMGTSDLYKEETKDESSRNI